MGVLNETAVTEGRALLDRLIAMLVAMSGPRASERS
jgi:hypothetical protein